MPQMLLVPVVRVVDHRNAAYEEAQPRSDDAPLLASGGDTHADAKTPQMMSGLQPSASLLAGEVGFADDDEVVTDGEAEYDRSPAVTFGLGGGEKELAGWEDVTCPSALEAEIEAAVQSAANQHEWEDIRPISASPGGGGVRVYQSLLGKWRATNVLRHGSLPGMLYLFEETLVFKGEWNQSDGSEEAAAVWLKQLAGQIWRWRLERLTQVIHSQPHDCI